MQVFGIEVIEDPDEVYARVVQASMLAKIARAEELDRKREEAERTGNCMTCGLPLSVTEEWECQRCIDGDWYDR